jgi:glutamate N-acetyltransferase/amino-acid N-acetyltransferase
MSVCMPGGFLAAGESAGIKRKKGALDLALIVSEAPAAAAGCFTVNRAAAAPVIVSRSRVPSEGMRGIVINSGCANALTGSRGYSDASAMAAGAAEAVGAAEGEMLVASTGMIGTYLPLDDVLGAVRRAAAGLAASDERVAQAILTTDTRRKTAAFQGERWTVGAIAKGAGMISPQMATMIAVVTTDAQVGAEELEDVLGVAVSDTFNRISVDGDMSTNDSVLAFANGASGVRPAAGELSAAVLEVCSSLARQIVADGEGAEKVIRVAVEGAAVGDEAEAAARAVGSSLLVKTAVHGGDPNWGRVAAALGASGARFDAGKLTIRIGGVDLLQKGEPVAGAASAARKAMTEDLIEIVCELDSGSAGAEFWTCDLSEEYVRINTEYES